jgi:hypothetical protein
MKTAFRWVPVFGLLVFPTSVTYSQYYFYNSRFYESDLCWKLGISGGLMNSLTDLGGRNGYGQGFVRDVNWRLSKPAVSVYSSVLYKQWAGLLLQASYGKVAGTDAWPRLREIAAGRFMRNLSFESTIAEILLAGEIHPVEWLFPGRSPESCFSPYFLLGGGFFGFNPVARSGNTLIRLAPLHTEGQGFAEYPDRKPYALRQANIAAGIAAGFEISAVIHLAVECVYRKLFTDYLDDVSTTYIDPQAFYRNLPPGAAEMAIKLSDRRYEISSSSPVKPGEKRGNPGKKDAYFTFQLKGGMILGRERKRF